MLRHPHYLELPWEMHWEHAAPGHHRHLWWFIAALVLMAMFMVGVGVISGNW